MARFFKYADIEEFRAGCRELNLSLGVSSASDVFAKSAKVGNRIAGNRFSIQPMEGCDGDPSSGTPGELTVRRWLRYAESGAKMIWGEAVALDFSVRANPRQLVLTEENKSVFRDLITSTRNRHRERFGNDDDFLIGIQLTHSGRYSFESPIRAISCPILDANPAQSCPLVTDDELEKIQDDFVAACKRVRDIGADFVDIKQCHRYLLSEILAGKDRPGKFGGDLAGRSRFFLTLVERIKQEVHDLLIATRLNVYDGVPFKKSLSGAGEPVPFQLPYRSGFGNAEDDPFRVDLSEPNQLMGEFQRQGVALVNVTMGCPYFNPHVLRPAEFPPIDGYLPPEHPLLGVDRHVRATASLQHAYPGMPMLGSAYSYLQEFLFDVAADTLSRQNATFIGLGRASLSYPDAIVDILSGRPLDRKRFCRTFSYCTNLMRSKNHPLGQFPTGCPPFDREPYHEIYEQAKQSWKRPT